MIFAFLFFSIFLIFYFFGAIYISCFAPPAVAFERVSPRGKWKLPEVTEGTEETEARTNQRGIKIKTVIRCFRSFLISRDLALRVGADIGRL